MDGSIPIRNQVFRGGELAPFARTYKNSRPSITDVPERLKLRKRCSIRAQIRRKLLRDDADLPPWFLAISTPMQSNESIRACATPGPLAPHLTRPSGSRHKHSEEARWY
jgi:hypothetical protein